MSTSNNRSSRRKHRGKAPGNDNDGGRAPLVSPANANRTDFDSGISRHPYKQKDTYVPSSSRSSYNMSRDGPSSHPDSQDRYKHSSEPHHRSGRDGYDTADSRDGDHWGVRKTHDTHPRATESGRRGSLIKATQQLPVVNNRDGESRDSMTTDRTLTATHRIGEEESRMMSGEVTGSLVLEETADGKATMAGIRGNVTVSRIDVRQTIKTKAPKQRKTVHGNLVQDGNPVEVAKDTGTNALATTTSRVRTRGRRSIKTVSDNEGIENVTEADTLTVNVDHLKIP
ncbi:hypothetical protein EDD17DRAFT_317686 [Pisolithus thermaeus]|nr:hypothetical protein EDD17DRAFT_317686 [Pisolithus thermaeus]